MNEDKDAVQALKHWAQELRKQQRENQMLDQLENLLIEVEKAPKENTPTMKAFIVLARAVYYLMRERCR